MPELPTELEREIFELAFRCNRDTAFKSTLSLVARRVHLWVDRVFYEMVSIDSKEHAAKFISLIDSNLKPPGFFTAVKTLCLPYDVKAAQAYIILSACTAVQQLACWVKYTDVPDIPLLLSQCPLRRLSIEFTHFSNIPATPSTWILSLTHVELVIWVEDLPPAELSTLSRLPSLTHVALPFRHMGSAHAVVVLSSCPSLQVLTFIVQNSEFTVPEEYEFDPRIVLQDDPDPGDGTADWEAPYFGLSDIWSRAEDIVQQRKALHTSGTGSQ
ncbi:hypothetical protein DFH07DRAFT_914109 [Mycena maculata]|uniref:F-box domain-containing protein n=1 Tax=Mycena maculata TaxID=230809 RepID=A0AAD7JVH4_9AGAR|nr:hypothetical protein DFH07DRAFT_914109 [Mycena maculata]